MRQPTNQVLLEKINNIHEKIDNFRVELKEVKLETNKNTEFRNKAVGVVAVVTMVGSFVGGMAMWALSKVWK